MKAVLFELSESVCWKKNEPGPRIRQRIVDSEFAPGSDELRTVGAAAKAPERTPH